MDKKELLQSWYNEVWVNGNVDAIPDYFQQDMLATGVVPEMQVGADDFAELVMAFRAHVDKIEVEMPIVVDQDDWISAFLKVRMIRADTDAPVEVTGQVMARYKNGKIVEAYNQFDFVSLFEQLGQLPEDTIPICMTGQRLDWA